MKYLATKLVSAVVSILAISCNSNGDKQNSNNQDTVQTIRPKTEKIIKIGKFDINTIPFSDKDLGDFPFFSFPKDLEAQNKPLQKSFDEIYFPIKGIFIPIEGKSWKSYIVKAQNSQNDWSLPYFLKSYDAAVIAVGGVKIYDGKVSKEELNRIKDKAKYFGEEGSIDYWNEPVRTYLIRRRSGDDVYIQIFGNTASGAIQILQKEDFKQTIKQIKSDQIQKDLNEKGKSILYINFETDKATLKADGKEVVSEITKVLNEDRALKININGYTDNTGDAKHNLALSKERAEMVKNQLIENGIEAKRLESAGFGSSNPISDNDSEDGKAKNRRVELVKK